MAGRWRGAVDVVLAWQEAINRRDEVRLGDLTDPQIAIVGPRGTARGFGELLDWLGRAGLSLTTQRVFARGDAVVLAQHGVWRAVDGGRCAARRKSPRSSASQMAGWCTTSDSTLSARR